MHHRSIVKALAVAGLLSSGSAMAAFEPFCVNSLAMEGATATPEYTTLTTTSVFACDGIATPVQDGFTANNLNGKYAERLVVTDLDIATPELNFTSTVFATWNAFAFGGLSINDTLLNEEYDLYAIVRASGTLLGGKFEATGATVELWADQFKAPNGARTVQNLTGSLITGLVPEFDGNLEPVLTGFGSEDKLLLTGTYLSGSGDAAAPGKFQFFFENISLTELGGKFFIAPRPFYVNLLADGDVDTEGFNVSAPGQFDLSGDVSANFYQVVPEPGSLALAGLALLGLGAARRRSS